MAVGKNKRLTKSKKGGKKKAVDVFTKKEWYEVRAPSLFQERNCAKTIVTRSAGQKIASDSLKGRVFELNLADLNKDEDQAFRKIKLQVEEVQGTNCLTNFHGMDLTRDKTCSLIKKWQSLVEARADVRTTDGYTVRLFCIGFTMRMPNQIKKTCYAQSAQRHAIIRTMNQIMTEEASKCDLRELFQKLIPGMIATEISRACHSIFPLQNVYVRKVKILKKPKFDLVKLMELHGEGGADEGKAIARHEEVAVEAMTGSGGRL